MICLRQKIILESGTFVIEKLERLDRQVSHKLIESFMLAANETVAEHMHKINSPFVYRVHEKPSQLKLDSFSEFIKPLGLKVKADNSPITPKDLQLFLATIEKIRI